MGAREARPKQLDVSLSEVEVTSMRTPRPTGSGWQLRIAPHQVGPTKRIQLRSTSGGMGSSGTYPVPLGWHASSRAAVCLGSERVYC